jgi:hypothetical protein
MNAQETNLDSQTFTVLDTMTGEVVCGFREVERYKANLCMLQSVDNEKPWQQLEVNESVCVRSGVRDRNVIYRIVRVS